MSDKSSDKETEIPRSEAFKKVDDHVHQIQEILDREILRVEKERNAFESVARKLEHVHFSSTIKLNVGGQLFTTSLKTLTKDAGSMLHAMFSGRFDTKPAKDGSYFIDRDGTYFRYILNFLRTGKLSLPEDQLVRKDVLEEAMFYQIQGIVDELNQPPKVPEPAPKPPAPVYYSDSSILSAIQAKWLVSVQNLSKSSNLLYRASRDGWTSSVFHSKCDSFSGPTVVVIKSTGGYIFGGYTEQNWSGAGVFKADPSAFLFSIDNPGGTTPVQMKVAQNQQNAIHCNNSYGPTFGGNHDLYICDSSNITNTSFVNIGNCYSLPSGQSPTNFLTGSRNFNVAEMEVYGLQK